MIQTQDNFIAVGVEAGAADLEAALNCIFYKIDGIGKYKELPALRSAYTHAKLLPDVTEEEAAGLVDVVDFDQDGHFIKNYYANYEDNPMPHYDSATQSLSSLIRSLGYKEETTIIVFIK